MIMLFIDRFLGSHQRKKTFVKRHGRLVALIVVILVAWGFLLRVMPVSARWRGAGDLRGVSEGMLELREA
jgi:hypothetical protein